MNYLDLKLTLKQVEQHFAESWYETKQWYAFMLAIQHVYWLIIKESSVNFLKNTIACPIENTEEFCNTEEESINTKWKGNQKDLAL